MIASSLFVLTGYVETEILLIMKTEILLATLKPERRHPMIPWTLHTDLENCRYKKLLAIGPMVRAFSKENEAAHKNLFSLMHAIFYIDLLV